MTERFLTIPIIKIDGFLANYVAFHQQNNGKIQPCAKIYTNVEKALAIMDEKRYSNFNYSCIFNQIITIITILFLSIYDETAIVSNIDQKYRS